MSATAISALIGTLLSVISGLFVIRQWYLHRGDETAKQRDDRQAQARIADAQERKDDLQRYDTGVWRIVEDLRETVERQELRLAEMERTIGDLRDQNINVRADLAQAKVTIARLTGENDRLKGRVLELEGKAAC